MRWYLGLFLCLLPTLVVGQPATIESAVNHIDNDDLASYTTGNVTVPAESNLGMAICISSGETTGTDPRLTSVTWSLGGGEPFTPIVANDSGQPAGSHYVAIYYLVAPTAGTGTVTYVFPEAQPSGAATVYVLSGAAQSNPTLSGVHGDGTSSGTRSVELITTVNDSLLITCYDHSNGSIPVTHGAGQTEHYDLQANAQRHASSTEEKGVAGSETVTAAPDSGTPFNRFAAIAVEPFVAPPVVRRRAQPILFK